MPKSATEQESETALRRAPRTPPTLPRVAWLIGPALVAGVAYLDPGNVASNMTAGAMYGYLLVWVVVLGNVMAWLIQYLSAKLGIVTGRSLPETLGPPHPQPLGAPRVLAAGRARRDGDRHRRGHRRRRRTQPAVRHPARWGRRHHRHRVDRAAARPVPARPAHVRVRRHRPARHHRDRLHVRRDHRAARCRRSRRRARAPVRGHRVGAARGIASSARRSCRTRSTRTAPSPATASPPRARASDPAATG